MWPKKEGRGKKKKLPAYWIDPVDCEPFGKKKQNDSLKEFICFLHDKIILLSVPLKFLTVGKGSH